MTKFLNISTDNTLGGSSASDETVSSQKAIKTYIERHSLLNTATGTDSLTLLGNPCTANYGTNIGYNSTSGAAAIALGANAYADRGVAIGNKATAYNSGAVAIGTQAGYDSSTISGQFIGIGYNAGREGGDMSISIGQNVSTSKTGIITLGYSPTLYSAGEIGETDAFYIVFNGTGYKLLDSIGTIPDGRISSNIARTSAIPTNVSDLTNDSGYITSSALSGYAQLASANTYTAWNTFTGGISNRASYTKGVVPQEVSSCNFMTTDVNGDWTGSFENYADTNGNVIQQMALAKPDGSGNFAAFQIGYDPQSNEFASASNGVRNSITNWSMPSTTASTLTLGASGASYTAPANGYVRIDGTLDVVGGYVELIQDYIDSTVQTPASGNYTRQFIPVRKGSFVVNYAGFTAAAFIFIYAVGG